MPKDAKVQKLYRSFTLSRETINKDARTVELAFSSEMPVERCFGLEILDHSMGAVRLDRLKSSAPLLMDHDTTDQVGVIESAIIGSDRVGRAIVRFGKSARADEVFNDVVDGIRTKVSVGYMVNKWQLEGSNGEQETYRITDWEPFEISLVAVPADNSVGVGRNFENEFNPLIEGKRSMPQANEAAASAAAPNTASNVDVKAIQTETRNSELQRIRDLENIGAQFKDFGGVELARQFIAEGKDVATLNSAILERVGKKAPPSAEIGMTENEVRKFSFVRALNALANPKDPKAQEAAGFEREVSIAAAMKLSKEARGYVVPVDVLKRDLTVGTSTAGGNLVATNLLAGSFIDMLRNSMALNQVGTTMLTDLVGNIAISRQTGGATAYWVAEGNPPTESQQAFDQVTLSPKTVGAFTDISRKLLLQSSVDVESLVKRDIALTLALAIDAAAINGSGSSNQPLGILNTSGIGSVAGGTNGATVTWDNLIDLEAAVANANAAIGSLAYLTNTKQRGKMKKTTKVSGYPVYLWDNSELPINGYKAGISNQIPSNLTKGSASGICSAIIFGNFVDAILGMWGGLDLTVDPYTGSTSGTVRVVALQDVDFAVRHPESFAAMKDAL